MKSVIFVGYFLTFMVFTGACQQYSNKDYVQTAPLDENIMHTITVGAGVSFPMASFSEKDVGGNGIQGFVLPGFHSNLEFNLSLKGMLFLGIGVYHNINPSDVSGLTAFLEEDLPNSIIEIKANNWTQTAVLVGLQVGVPDGRLTYRLKAQAGIYTVTSPEIYAIQKVDNELRRVTQEEKLSVSLGFHVGGEISYKFLPFMGVSVGVNYLTTEASFERLMYVNSSGFGNRVSFKQRVSTINVFLSLCFYLKK